MKTIICNFKMNLDYEEIKKYIEDIKDYKDIIFAPSYIYLKHFTDENLLACSQDVSEHSLGAYTGDISASQLSSISVSYSLVGHSEIREKYNDDKNINEKIKRLLENKIQPILCIGDTLEEKKSGSSLNKLKKQIDDALINTNIQNIIIAYEPIYCIGTKIIPETNDLNETIEKLIKHVQLKFNITPTILYGGSVNENNIKELNTINNIGGYLIGGCSLNSNSIKNIYNYLNIRQK